MQTTHVTFMGVRKFWANNILYMLAKNFRTITKESLNM